MTAVRIWNPWTGALALHDISGLTPAELEALALDDDVCADVAAAVAPCPPEEFLAAYVDRVGPVRAGIRVLGDLAETRARLWTLVNGVDVPTRRERRLVRTRR